MQRYVTGKHEVGGEHNNYHCPWVFSTRVAVIDCLFLRRPFAEKCELYSNFHWRRVPQRRQSLKQLHYIATVMEIFGNAFDTLLF